MNGVKEAGADRVSVAQRLREALLGQTARDRRNGWRYTAWTFLWLFSLATVKFVLERTGLEGPLAWAVTAVPIILSLVALRAYLRFLREADELTRRVQLEAVAFGFAVGLIVHFAWFPLSQLGAPALDRSGLMTGMVVAYLAGMGVAARRYR
jgi:hypothetical protein